MYPSDHLPPHFHVVGPDTEALVSLERLEILAGRARQDDLKAVLTWAADNLELLWRHWRSLNQTR
jgi:hypothetical protein